MISLPAIAVSIPCIAAFLALAAGEMRCHRDLIGIICGLALMLVSGVMFNHGLNNIWLESTTLNIAPIFTIKLVTEPAGLIFLAIIAVLWPVTTLYASGYMQANGEKSQSRFFFFFHLAIGCAAGIAMAGNLSTTFIFYEALTLSTLPLVTHSGTAEARKAGKLYLLTLLGASVLFLLPAIIITARNAGSLEYISGGLLARYGDNTWLGWLLALYIFGIAKSAIMPLHRWLPAAMVAPVPVSALLHAVAVVKSGVFIIIKLVIYVFGVKIITAISGWLILIAAITLLAAGAIATRHDELKARLAYSTISQLSYIILAAASATIYGLRGAILHMIAHAFGKITLFFTAGSIATASGVKYLNRLNGIAKAMPQTMTAFTIGALTIFGAPFTLGFVSKWHLLHNQSFEMAAVILGGTAISMCYLLPVIWQSLKPAAITSKRLPLTMLVAQAISAICCVALLLLMPHILTMLEKIEL